MPEITSAQLNDGLRSVHSRNSEVDREIVALTRQVLSTPGRRQWFTVPTILLGIGLTFAGVGTAAAVVGPEVLRLLGGPADNSITAVMPSGAECDFYFRVPTETSGAADISEQIEVSQAYLRNLDLATIHADPVTVTAAIDGETGETLEQDVTFLEAAAFNAAVADEVWTELDRRGFARVTTFDSSWECEEGFGE